LKKNTQEWQEQNASGKGTPNGRDGGERPSSSRQTSSSSIPSDADGEEDKRTKDERTRDQEGPLGRGPGKHEPEIKLNGGSVYDSPDEEEEREMPTIPAPRGSAGDGTATPVPPEYFQDQTKEDIPDRKEQGEGDRVSPEERVVPRTDKKVAKRFTDEMGHYPEGLLPVKGENPPGSQNEIVLNSRTPLIHVSPSLSQETSSPL
jgi:hypothetical protein